MNNSSTIFGSNIMGGRDKTPEEIIQEQEIQEQKSRLIQEDSLLQALTPINFEDKIMGGQNAKNFLEGKLPRMDDSYSYTEKVNMLTGKGTMTGAGIDNMFKMNLNFNMPKMNPGKKNINQITGLNKQKTKDLFKTDMFNTKTNTQNNPFTNNPFKNNKEVFSMKPINPFKNHTNKEATQKINQALNMGTQNVTKNNDMNRLIQALNPTTQIKNTTKTNNDYALNKINQALGLGKQNVTKNEDINRLIYGTNPTQQIKQTKHTQKNEALNKITNSFGVLNNAVGSQKINQILNYLPNPEAQTRQTLGLPYNERIKTTYDPVSKILGTPRYDKWSMNYEEPETVTYYEPQLGDNGYTRQNLLEGISKKSTFEDEMRGRFASQDYIETSLQQLNTLLQDPEIPGKEKEKIAKTVGDLKKTQRLEQEAKQKGDLVEAQRLRAVAEAQIKSNTQRYEIDKRIELGDKQIEYQKGKDILQDTRERDKLKATTQLERERLALQAQKGDIQLMESKLKAGTNLMQSLTGGGGRNILTPETLTGGSDRQAYNIALMSGAMTQTPGFQDKVQDSVGTQQTSKPFAQRVQETISMKTPEQVLQEERAQQEQMQQQMMQQQYQPQRPTPQPQLRYYEEPTPQYARQPQQPQYEIDWNRLPPQEAAKYDPEYAKYMEKTDDKTEYRRGPYKK